MAVAKREDKKETELKRLTERLLYNMPTKLELRNYNAKTRMKQTDWEKKNILNVERWRILRREQNLSTNLESIRPSGYAISPGQFVKGSKDES